MKRRSFFAAAAALPFVGELTKPAAMAIQWGEWKPSPESLARGRRLQARHVEHMSMVGRLEQLMTLHEHGMIDDETFRRLST